MAAMLSPMLKATPRHGSLNWKRWRGFPVCRSHSRADESPEPVSSFFESPASWRRLVRCAGKRCARAGGQGDGHCSGFNARGGLTCDVTRPHSAVVSVVGAHAHAILGVPQVRIFILCATDEEVSLPIEPAFMACCMRKLSRASFCSVCHHAPSHGALDLRQGPLVSLQQVRPHGLQTKPQVNERLCRQAL